jgi:hypothetical protein
MHTVEESNDDSPSRREYIKTQKQKGKSPVTEKKMGVAINSTSTIKSNSMSPL